MSVYLELERDALNRLRPPVMLLGGINLVRALGLARIPVIVASPSAYTPAMSSRYTIGRCELPRNGEELVAPRILDVHLAVERRRFTNAAHIMEPAGRNGGSGHA